MTMAAKPKGDGEVHNAHRKPHGGGDLIYLLLDHLDAINNPDQKKED